MSGAIAPAIVLAAVAFAAVPAPSRAEVPPEAQPAFNKGVLAAHEQEWDIALQSFQEARKSAPNSPEIYYNLGLTESKIPGRELRAIAWLAAYLAADPQAPTGSAVKTAIQGLLVKNEGNLDRFIAVARQAAEQVPPGGVEREVVLSQIFALYAEKGDEAKAASLAGEAHLDEGDLRANKALLAMTIFGGRDGIERARNLAPSPAARGLIAIGEAKIGDISGALKDISLMSDTDYPPNGKTSALIEVARAQFKSGQKQASWATLKDARTALPQMKSNDLVSNTYYVPVCTAQVRVGDFAGARATADLMAEDGNKDSCLEEIGIAQLAMGDVSSAQSTTNHIDTAFIRERTQDEIDQYNKDPVARKTVLNAVQSLATDDWLHHRDNGDKWISGGFFDYEVTPGNPTKASDWLAEIDDGDHGLSKPVFLDFSTYVASVTDPSHVSGSGMDPRYISADHLFDTARRLLAERRFIMEMLAKQFGSAFVQ